MNIKTIDIRPHDIQLAAQEAGIASCDIIWTNGRTDDGRLILWRVGDVDVVETNGNSIWREDDPEGYLSVLLSEGATVTATYERARTGPETGIVDVWVTVSTPDGDGWDGGVCVVPDAMNGGYKLLDGAEMDGWLRRSSSLYKLLQSQDEHADLVREIEVTAGRAAEDAMT